MTSENLTRLFFLFLVMIFLIGIVSAEKIEIKIKNVNAENINFKIILYDDSGNKLNEKISYNIQNYYIEIVSQGNVNSGEETVFTLPKNPVQGPWKINAKYNGAEANELFNVGDIEKADIKLEGNNLIIENIGNVPYDKNILVYIGENHQTARVYLEIGQVKKIRLTAPDGSYTVKVSDGTEENNLVFNNVGLTGNVVGLERVLEGSFFKKYPLVSLFLGTLLLVFLVVIGLKIYKKHV